jgi:hypothetical protein
LRLEPDLKCDLLIRRQTITGREVGVPETCADDCNSIDGEADIPGVLQGDVLGAGGLQRKIAEIEYSR